MKVLDLPDEQDNPIREILLKQDNNTLEELVKKSSEEIKSFLITAKKDNLNNKKILDNQNNRQNNELKNSLLNKNETTIITKETQEQKLNITTIKNYQEKTFEDNKNNEKFDRLKSAFPQSILDKNQTISD